MSKYILGITEIIAELETFERRYIVTRSGPDILIFSHNIFIIRCVRNFTFKF